MLKKIFKNLIKKKGFSKYFIVGGFAFFLIKGLVWLAIFFMAGFSLLNLS